MKKHSHVGGSVASRILACPGSLTLARSVLGPTPPDDRGSIYAREGTMLHHVIEQAVKEPKAAVDLIGTVVADVEYTKEHHDTKIYPALVAFRDFCSDFPARPVFDFEVEVSAAHALHPDAYGTTDAIGRQGDTMIVLDWKFGDGVRVEAANNAQLMFYAYCALSTRGLEDYCVGVNHVELVIVQPMRDEGRDISRHRVTVKEVLDFGAKLKAALEQAEQPSPPFALGEHCRWCKVKLHCDLQRGGIAELSHRIGSDDLGELLQRCERAEDFIKEVRAEAQARLEAGQSVKGWKLVAKRGMRTWTDEKVAEEKLRKVGGLLAREVYPREIISPAQAEKLLKARKRMYAMQDIVTSVSSGNTIAPIDDPRPSVLNVAAFAAAVARVGKK